MKIKFTLLVFIINISSNALIFAQSTSVFNASYFTKGDLEPPIRLGVGFDITDVFNPKNSCFMPESVSKEKLTRTPGETGTNTVFNICYTKDESEFNSLQLNGISGKATFLNIFNVSASNTTESSSKFTQKTERLIIIAKVDFGKYFFEAEPALIPNAQTLIEEDKIEDFIRYYGTHYINGIRKGNSIWVIIEKKENESSFSESEKNTVGVGVDIPLKGGGSFEISNAEKAEKFFKNGEFSASIEVKGPYVELTNIKKKVNEIVKGSGEDKINAIMGIVEGAMANLYDPEKSMITQYYYKSFTMSGISKDKINWDENKENKLSSINDLVVKTRYLKNTLEAITAKPTGLQAIFEKYATIEDLDAKEQLKKDLASQYNELYDGFKYYYFQMDTTYEFLKKKYLSCNDIVCNANNGCCDLSYSENIKQLTSKINSNINKMYDIYFRMYLYAAIPCLGQNFGYVTINNSSSNQYSISAGDELLGAIEGGGSETLELYLGDYNFTAIQDEGYIIDPTVNYRAVTISEPCEELEINIGFEDE